VANNSSIFQVRILEKRLFLPLKNHQKTPQNHANLLKKHAKLVKKRQKMAIF